MQGNRNAGRGGITAHTWDARAELALAAFIRRHLDVDPPPQGSAIAADLHEYASILESDGTARLEALGGRRLGQARAITATLSPLGGA